MIKTEIYPEEIEEAYKKTAPVKEMCVFTVSGMKGAGEQSVIWALVQPDLDYFREFGELNLRMVFKERFDNASQSLPSYKRLKGFTVTLQDLPHTLPGKINRSAVKEIYEPRVIAGIESALPVSGKLSAEDLLLTGSGTGIKILECLKEQGGLKRPISPADSLELDLGIDSLGRIELISRLELAFGADIKYEAIGKVFSVKDLIIGIADALKVGKAISVEDRGISLGPDYWKEHLDLPPEKEYMEILKLSTGLLARIFRFILIAIDCLVFKLFFGIKAEGRENVPRKEACILYGNHSSFLDGPAIAAALPHRPGFQVFYFVFEPYFFRPIAKSRILRKLVKMARFIPFDFSLYLPEALRASYLVLKQGKSLCYFPEGSRSSTGVAGTFQKGFGLLAKETGAKLVPVAIEGAHEAWSSTEKYPRPHPIKVKFGKPILPQDLEKEGLAMGAQNPYDAICVAARKKLIELKAEVGDLGT